MKTEQLYDLYKKNPSVQTDTRKLKPGDIFFALKGDNFNGNTFANQAIGQGAIYAVIDEKRFEIPGKTILVDNVLSALQQLAKYHRQQFTIPILAITGSNGKTTTKELIHAVLSTTYKTYTTEGNLNNHIGIPLTLLKIKEDAQMAVIEMGANHIGEIAAYCTIAFPDHGLITNCGNAHLEGFGSEEGVRKAKGELFDHLRTLANAIAFVNWDYDYLQQLSKGISKIVKYGTVYETSISGKVFKNDPLLEVEITKGLTEKNIKTNLVGDYNLPNVLAAIAVGGFFNVSGEKMKAAIENYHPSNSRSQLLQQGTNKIILDAYNANPASLKLAIENFAGIASSGKVLMLGGMAELGKDSIAEHEKIIELINQYSWQAVVLVGGDFLRIDHPYLKFETSLKAKEWMQQQHFENTWFLIKGSRSIEMEKVLY